MKMFKVAYVMICLLAYMWAFSSPARGQEVQLAYASNPAHAAITDNLPVKLLIERTCPLFGDRQMSSKIAEIPAGYSVVVLENYDLQRANGFVVLRVVYVDSKGKQYTGWVSGTLHVHYPR